MARQCLMSKTKMPTDDPLLRPNARALAFAIYLCQGNSLTALHCNGNLAHWNILNRKAESFENEMSNHLGQNGNRLFHLNLNLDLKYASTNVLILTLHLHFKIQITFGNWQL